MVRARQIPRAPSPFSSRLHLCLSRFMSDEPNVCVLFTHTVTMKWFEHRALPEDLPGPDFIAMNKLAAVNNVVTTREVSAFRSVNNITIRSGNHGRMDKTAVLPSDNDPEHAYGRPSAVSSIEDTRFGDSVSIKALVNGEYAGNRPRRSHNKNKGGKGVKKVWIYPKMTKAASGHAVGKSTLAEDVQAIPFKLSKFSGVPGRVHSHGGKT